MPDQRRPDLPGAALPIAIVIWPLARERNSPRENVTELEKHLEHLFDRDTGAHKLAAYREELAALNTAIIAQCEPALGFTLTPQEAADLLGMGRRELTRLIDLTPPRDRPCADTCHGGLRRHLRFNETQLKTWIKEKPWQTNAPIQTAGSSDGGNRPRLTLVSAFNAPGQA